MVLNSGVEQVCWESLGLQGDPPSHIKGNQSWIFIGRTNPEIEPPILWPTDVKNWLIRKDPVTGKDWRQEKKRMTEDKTVGWITNSMDMSLPKLLAWWRTATPGMLQSMGFQRVGHDWVTELNWTYHIENTICNGRVPPARLGASQGPDTYPWSIKFSPMHRSHCLAFTRHSVSSDCRRTSILVDIKE